MLELVDETDHQPVDAPAVLMVRIVDSAGRAVRADDLADICYSIYELTARRDRKRVIPGHQRAPLRIADVFFDSLQLSRWSIDVAGYNFRHEIDIDRLCERSDGITHLEIEYDLTPKAGEKTTIRFQLKGPGNG